VNSIMSSVLVDEHTKDYGDAQIFGTPGSHASTALGKPLYATALCCLKPWRRGWACCF
jgi:hypothetical protein